MRITQIGTELPLGELLLKYNSAQTFDMAFWEDEAATTPSDLSSYTITLEVVHSSSTTTWTAAIAANRAIWTLTSTDTNVTWQAATFQVVLTDTDRIPVLSGSVRIQR